MFDLFNVYEKKKIKQGLGETKGNQKQVCKINVVIFMLEEPCHTCKSLTVFLIGINLEL